MAAVHVRGATAWLRIGAGVVSGWVVAHRPSCRPRFAAKYLVLHPPSTDSATTAARIAVPTEFIASCKDLTEFNLKSKDIAIDTRAYELSPVIWIDYCIIMLSTPDIMKVVQK